MSGQLAQTEFIEIRATAPRERDGKTVAPVKDPAQAQTPSQR